jgi:hypothetical protein
MHYVNCYDELHERISNFENLPSQKYVYFNKLGAFKKGEEYLNYYNYKHVHIYVMWGGFVPKIFSRYCFTV